MSVLTRPPAPAEGDRASLRSPVLVGALAALQAAAASLACVVLPVVAAALAASGLATSWMGAARIGADAWLLAHHTGIATGGGHVGLVPLGLTAVAVAWCCLFGRRAAVALGPVTDVVGLRRSGGRAVAAFSGTYALVVAVVSLLAAGPAARPVSGQALLGGAVLAASAAGVSVLLASRSVAHPSAWNRLCGALRLPAAIRRSGPPAVASVLAWLAAGAVVVAVALVAGWEGVVATHRALEPGVAGGAALALAQLALVPDAVVWAGAWLAGPGFAVGEGTSVTPAAVELGPLPAVPLLAALPTPGAFPAPVALVLLVPVAAGVVGGALLHRRGGTGWLDAALDVLLTGIFAGVLGGAVTWAASGPAGPGRMSVVGASPLVVAAVLAAEVAVGASLAVLVARVAGGGLARAPTGQLARVGNGLRSLIQRS